MLLGRPSIAFAAAGRLNDALRGRASPFDNADAIDVAEVAVDRESASDPAGATSLFSVLPFWSVDMFSMIPISTSPSSLSRGIMSMGVGGDMMLLNYVHSMTLA